MTEPVLEVRDLVKHYPVRNGLLRRSVSAVKAVDGVSLTLGRGRTLGLVGESGSGKSTLARVLVGIEAPTSGQVLVDGEDVVGLSRAGRKQLRRDVQMVFQDPYTSLNPRMSVSEIVGEPFAIHGIDPAGGRRAVGGRAAGARRPGPRPREPVPAPVLRRPAAARRHRPRARAAAQDPGVRRAGLGARRVGAGPGDQPAGGPPGGARPVVPVRRARPRRWCGTSPTTSR